MEEHLSRMLSRTMWVWFFFFFFFGDLEYDFNYKPPEINIVDILTVFFF